MDYELLLGDHREIENWILEGRVDCGFLRLPTGAELDTVFLEQDPLLAVLPQNHALAGKETVTAAELCRDPFLMLRKGENDEVAEVFAGGALTPNVRFTTWDDYAIMSMVESGLGVSILPELILRRVPYHIVIKELDVPAYRTIALSIRDRQTASLAVKRFVDYLDYRNSVSPSLLKKHSPPHRPPQIGVLRPLPPPCAVSQPQGSISLPGGSTNCCYFVF